MATKKTVKTIRERLDGKMWKAVQAMIDGLNEQSERKDFEIDMSTFGIEQSKICFGCAATCTIQKIAKKNLTNKNIYQRSMLGFEATDLRLFETAINNLREGSSYELKKYLGIPKETSVSFVKKLPRLRTDNWQKNLPVYQKYADLLKEKDI